MKTKSLKFIVLTVLIAFVLSSCNKDETNTDNRTYLDDITGTYSGVFTTEINQEDVPGTAVVSKTSDNELQIHCYGEIMDTTIIMDAYENGDSIMLCNTGSDFEHEYGHMGNGYHMMDMMQGETEWMHHMNTDHQAGDEHFGGFDMMDDSFGFMFRRMHNDTLQIINFNGIKNH